MRLWRFCVRTSKLPNRKYRSNLFPRRFSPGNGMYNLESNIRADHQNLHSLDVLYAAALIMALIILVLASFGRRNSRFLLCVWDCACSTGGCVPCGLAERRLILVSRARYIDPVQTRGSGRITGSSTVDFRAIRSLSNTGVLKNRKMKEHERFCSVFSQNAAIVDRLSVNSTVSRPQRHQRKKYAV